ncbi:MAG TPA: hypothetical protein VN446_07130 [Candidatus Acidoferrum sp.]|nr:hypothetical protein [Candidatus Acidoferrum sp.]
MDSVKAWTLTVCCAAVVAAIAGGLTPSANTEKQVKLTLSLFLLLAMFSAAAQFDLSALTVAIPTAESGNYARMTEVLADGALSLTRTMLAAQIEEAVGGGLTVCGLELEGEESISVKEVTFTSFVGRSPEELAEILAGELGITATIREVGS